VWCGRKDRPRRDDSAERRESYLVKGRKKRRRKEKDTHKGYYATFEAWDGNEVILTKERWGHLKEEHRNYKVWIEFLAKNISKPDFVRKAEDGSKAVWANYRFRHPRAKDYVVVLIGKASGKKFIVTARDNAEPMGGDLVCEPKEKKS